MADISLQISDYVDADGVYLNTEACLKFSDTCHRFFQERIRPQRARQADLKAFVDLINQSLQLSVQALRKLPELRSAVYDGAPNPQIDRVRDATSAVRTLLLQNKHPFQVESFPGGSGYRHALHEAHASRMTFFLEEAKPDLPIGDYGHMETLRKAYNALAFPEEKKVVAPLKWKPHPGMLTFDLPFLSTEPESTRDVDAPLRQTGVEEEDTAEGGPTEQPTERPTEPYVAPPRRRISHVPPGYIPGTSELPSGPQPSLTLPDWQAQRNVLVIYTDDVAHSTDGIPAPTGVFNGGNTSFLNALLRMIATIDGLSLSLTALAAGAWTSNEEAAILGTLLMAIRKSHPIATFANLTGLLYCFEQHANTQRPTENIYVPNFSSGQTKQQDPWELLEFLDKSLNWIVRSSCGFFMKNVYVCESCGSHTFDSDGPGALVVPLNIPDVSGEVTFRDCMAATGFYRPNLISQQCEQTGCRSQTANQVTAIQNNGPLIFVFKRFPWQTSIRSRLKHVTLPPGIFNLHDENASVVNSTRFWITAIVHWSGSVGETVHYFASVRQDADRWTELDDSVQRKNLRWDELNPAAYMLLCTPV